MSSEEPATGADGTRDLSPASISRNTVLALASQLLTAAVTAGLTLFLARVLGPEEFGVFSLALGISSTLLLVSDFGVSSSAARFAAEHRDQPDEVAEVLASALRLKLAFTSTVFLALVVLAGPIADAYDEPGLAWALRGMAVAMYGQSLMGLYGFAFTALGRVGVSFRIVAFKSAVEAVGTVALVLATAGASQAAFGRGAGFMAGGLLSLAISWRLLGRESVGIGVREFASTRRIAGYAGALFIVDTAFALFQQLDVLLIGAILTARAAGHFQAPLRLVTFLGYPAQALAHGVAPRLASQTGDRQVEPFTRAIRYTIVFQGLLVAPLVVWATPIIRVLLGSGYAESASVLQAVAPFAFLLGIGTLFAYSVNYLGGARYRVPLAIAAVAINFVIDVILLPKIGIVAGAIGTDVAFFVYVVGHIWVCRRLLDIPLVPIAAAFLQAVIAGLAMSAVLLAFGTSDVSVPAMLVGGVLGAAVYMAVLLLVRAVTIGEMRQLAGRLPWR